MYEETHGGSADIPDPNEMLEALLERLEDALQVNRAAANGVPPFAVEAELTEWAACSMPLVSVLDRVGRLQSLPALWWEGVPGT